MSNDVPANFFSPVTHLIPVLDSEAEVSVVGEVLAVQLVLFDVQVLVDDLLGPAPETSMMMRSQNISLISTLSLSHSRTDLYWRRCSGRASES